MARGSPGSWSGVARRPGWIVCQTGAISARQAEWVCCRRGNMLLRRVPPARRQAVSGAAVHAAVLRGRIKGPLTIPATGSLRAALTRCTFVAHSGQRTSRDSQYSPHSAAHPFGASASAVQKRLWRFCPWVNPPSRRIHAARPGLRSLLSASEAGTNTPA